MKIDLRDKVAIRSPNWLGDAIISMTAVRNLKKFLGERSLTIVTPQKLEDLWKACPFVDEVISLTHEKKIISSARQIRSAKIRSLILFPNSLRVGSEAFVARVPLRIGKAGHSRKLLLTHKLAPLIFNRENVHQKYDYMDMIRQVTGIEDEVFPEIISPSLANRKPQIAIFPGAEYGPAKQWISDRYIQLALELQKKTGMEILFCGAEKDKGLCEEMSTQVKGSRSLAGKTTLHSLIHLLQQIRFVVGNDSGAMHLAALLRTPAVAIFGSTEPQLTGPMSDCVRVIREHVVCSPCFLRECPIDFSCMKKISVDQVLNVALDSLNHSEWKS